jgi:hypothetical protein
MSDRVIKIFLASSSELKNDRQDFETFIGRKNSGASIKGIKLELVHWENFFDAMSITRKQDDYNKAISECDIFVGLFYTKAGKYTQEEFNTAWSFFKENGKPIIYIYIKTLPISPAKIDPNDFYSLNNFKRNIESLGHFYTEYTDISDLRDKFGDQLHFCIHHLSREEEESTDNIEVQNNYSFIHPQHHHLKSKTKKVVGRQFVFNAFQDFTELNTNGYFTIVGDPGEGKTTILSKFILDNQSRCAYYFIRLNVGQNKFNAFIDTIYRQLTPRFRRLSRFPANRIKDSSFLENLLHEVSLQLAPREKFFVIIDALDEIDMVEQSKHQSEKTNLLYLPENLPSNIYFLLARRRQDSLNRRLHFSNECHQKILDLKDYPENCREDMRSYISLFLNDNEYRDALKQWHENQGLIRDQFIELLCDKSENNFLYLSCVIPEITKGFYSNIELKRLPQGLINFYVQQWDRMFPHLYDDQLSDNQIFKHKCQLRVIDYLAQSSSPLTVKTIYQYAKNSFQCIAEHDILSILNGWLQFLDVEQIYNDKYYTIYHTSFQAFLDNNEEVRLTRNELKSPVEEAYDDATRSIDEEIRTYFESSTMRPSSISEEKAASGTRITKAFSSSNEQIEQHHPIAEISKCNDFFTRSMHVDTFRKFLLLATAIVVFILILRQLK